VVGAPTVAPVEANTLASVPRLDPLAITVPVAVVELWRCLGGCYDAREAEKSAG
jgi:hypothetical protein